MIKAILVVSFLLAGVASQAVEKNSSQDYCSVKSEKYPELQSGINKDTLCREAIAALVQQTNYKAGSPLELKVVGRETYSVSFAISYVTSENTYQLAGVEDWYPGGDSYFTLIK